MGSPSMPSLRGAFLLPPVLLEQPIFHSWQHANLRARVVNGAVPLPLDDKVIQWIQAFADDIAMSVPSLPKTASIFKNSALHAYYATGPRASSAAWTTSRAISPLQMRDEGTAAAPATSADDSDTRTPTGACQPLSDNPPSDVPREGQSTQSNPHHVYAEDQCQFLLPPSQNSSIPGSNGSPYGLAHDPRSSSSASFHVPLGPGVPGAGNSTHQQEAEVELQPTDVAVLAEKLDMVETLLEMVLQSQAGTSNTIHNVHTGLQASVLAIDQRLSRIEAVLQGADAIGLDGAWRKDSDDSPRARYVKVTPVFGGREGHGELAGDAVCARHAEVQDGAEEADGDDNYARPGPTSEERYLVTLERSSSGQQAEPATNGANGHTLSSEYTNGTHHPPGKTAACESDPDSDLEQADTPSRPATAMSEENDDRGRSAASSTSSYSSMRRRKTVP